ncbi:hypothetical protein [Tessaracoccus sp.]
MSITVHAPSAGEDAVAPPAPVDPNGAPWAYEMVHAGGQRRSYANTPLDLVTVLVPGYDTLTNVDQWDARLTIAVHAQTRVQASLCTGDRFTALPQSARDVLTASLKDPPTVPTWDHPIPLVLIKNLYQPAGPFLGPQPAGGMPPNVAWIDISDDLALLDSLDLIGFLLLNKEG